VLDRGNIVRDGDFATANDYSATLILESPLTVGLLTNALANVDKLKCVSPQTNVTVGSFVGGEDRSSVNDEKAPP
jgi:hypothetical protein